MRASIAAINSNRHQPLVLQLLKSQIFPFRSRCDTTGTRITISALFSTYAQRVIPYRVPGVDSNDVLYASEPEYVEKLQEMIGLILVGLETALGELGGKSDAPSGRALAACAISWCELAVGVTSLSPPLVALTSKLYGLASKSKFADKAALVNFGRHVAHLSKQRGGGHAELHTRLSALASK